MRYLSVIISLVLALKTVYGIEYICKGGEHFTSGNVSNIRIKSREDTFFLQLDYDTAGLSNWRTGDTIISKRAGPSTFAYNGKLFVISGLENGFTFVNSIISATVNDTVKDWYYFGTFPAKLCYAACVICGGYIYVIGGQDETGLGVQTVYYAKLIGDSIGEWKLTTSLPKGVFYTAAVSNGEYIYVLGGTWDMSSVFYKSVYRAKILPDGQLSEWDTLTPLPEPRWLHTACLSNDYIYVIGGAKDTNYIPEPTIFRAKIVSNGLITQWDTLSFPDSGRTSHGSAVVGSHLLIYGGVDWNTGKGWSCLVAKIDVNGDLVNWTKYPSLPVGEVSSAAYRGRIYVAGGWNLNTYNVIEVPYFTKVETTSTFVKEGVYVSPIIDIPEGYCVVYLIPEYSVNKDTTSILFSYRYAKDSLTWTTWSAESLIKDTIKLGVKLRYLQYKIKLQTSNKQVTPVFKCLKIMYSKFDPKLVRIEKPPLLVKADSVYYPEVVVKNQSVDFPQSFKVGCEIYKYDSFLVYVDTQSVENLSPLDTLHVTFKSWQVPSTPNVLYTLRFYLIANPEMDDTLENDISQKSVVSTSSKSDVAVININYPIDSIPRSVECYPVFVARNNGNIAVSALAECFIFERATKIYTDSTLVVGLLPGEEREIKFKEWIPQNVGTYTIKVKVNMGDNLDTNITNDSLTSTFYVREPRVDAFPVFIKVTEIPPNVSCTVKTSVAQNGEIEATIPVEFILKDLQLHEIVRDSQNILLDANDTGEVKFVFTSPSDTGNYIAYLITNLPEDINHANDTLSETIKVVGLGENLPSGVKLQVTNPAGKELVVKFSAKTGEEVKINMYDVNGRKVKEVFGGKSEKSSYVIKLNIEDLPSGVYFVKMTTPQHKLIRKVVIIK